MRDFSFVRIIIMNNKKKKLLWTLGLIGVFAAVVLFTGIARESGALPWNAANGRALLFPLVLLSAAVDSINPCAFSVLLLTIAFLFSLGKTRSGVLRLGSVYILGVFLAYLLIGLGILRALSFFGIPRFVSKFGASLLILLGGIGLLNEFVPSFPIKLRIPSGSHATMARLMEKASLPTAFLLGAFVGLCEFPCTGGPYLMILGLLHDKATYLSGAGYLFLYNFVFILPLALILLAASNEALLEKVQEWRKNNIKKFHVWGGIAVMILGILIFIL